MTNQELPNHRVSVAKLPASGMRIRLEAKGKDSPQIAAYLDILKLDSFSGLLNFMHWGRDGVKVEGEIKAALQTACPITLKPVPQAIDTTFSAKFVPDSSKLAKPRVNNEGEIVLELDGDDIPDVFEGDELDAWAIAIEYLALEIDLFARAQDAKFTDITTPPDDDIAEPSPFAILQSLKK
ncbi:MAG: YceD family protein [Rhizobiaceae bacterium]|nr:YceD family protein [Rhizobiaceae bacterium]